MQDDVNFSMVFFLSSLQSYITQLILLIPNMWKQIAWNNFNNDIIDSISEKNKNTWE